MQSRAVYYAVTCTSLHSALADRRRSDMDQPGTDNPQVKDVRPMSHKKITFFFFKKSENFEEKQFCRKKKKKTNATILVFQYQEDPIRPEISSPSRFRFQGGYPEREGRTKDEGPRTKDQGQRKSSCLIQDFSSLFSNTIHILLHIPLHFSHISSFSNTDKTFLQYKLPAS